MQTFKVRVQRITWCNFYVIESYLIAEWQINAEYSSEAAVRAQNKYLLTLGKYDANTYEIDYSGEGGALIARKPDNGGTMINFDVYLAQEE